MVMQEMRRVPEGRRRFSGIST